MEFYKHLLDPTYHRKTKSFIVACIFAWFGKIDSVSFTAIVMTYTATTAVEKVLKKPTESS